VKIKANFPGSMSRRELGEISSLRLTDDAKGTSPSPGFPFNERADLEMLR
jgi:hypothetical protein